MPPPSRGIDVCAYRKTWRIHVSKNAQMLLPFSLCFVWIGYQGSKLSQIGRTGLSFHYFNEVIDREGIFSM